MYVKIASGDVFSDCEEGHLDTVLFVYIYGAVFLTVSVLRIVSFANSIPALAHYFTVNVSFCLKG
jgi:hypothetical protein